MSTLRAVLAAVQSAPPGTGLDDVARRLGLSRDEVDAMVDFWVRRGDLTAEPLRGCPPGGDCGAGCPSAARAGTGDCPTLLVIGRGSTPGGRGRRTCGGVVDTIDHDAS